MKFILSQVEKISLIPSEYHFMTAQILSILVFVIILYVFSCFFSWFCNKFLARIISAFRSARLIKALREHKVFTALGFVAAALCAIHLHPVFITERADWISILMSKLTGLFIILSFFWLINSALDTLNHLYGRNPSVPVKGMVQALKLLLYLLTALIVLSLIIGRKPMYIITGLSAVAAVFSLIFKDPILGFAASIQLTTNKLIKIGDWIAVDSAGADGNIVDISLTSVRVQNFDMTIVSVPTYDLISKPFKNWSGMYEAQARRIQRSINIDVDTINFLDAPTLARLKKIELLTEYLEGKEVELVEFNSTHAVKENLLNGRHLTNIGTFRAYAEAYLRSRPYVVSDNPGLTLMVRQLPQSAQGLPLEIYCFFNTTVWLQYEAYQSDVFDHLFSVLPEFGLYAYQQPSGHNISQGLKLLLPKQK